MSSGFKKIKIAMPIILVIALVLSSLGVTAAMYDYSQYRDKELEEYKLGYKVGLTGNYIESDDWKVGDAPLYEEIRVENKGVAADGFGSAYVRIQFKEYMETGTVKYNETKERYMIDAGGSFLVYDTAAMAQDAWPEHMVSGKMTDVVTGAAGFFIQTRDRDSNGQFGKYVVTEYSNSMENAEPVIPGSVRAPDKARGKHYDPEKGECAYPLHKWEAVGRLPTSDFIKWTRDEDAVALSDWIVSPGSGAFWVYDDLNGTGWVYWMQPLEPETVTAKFAVQAELIKQPTIHSGEAKPFYYVIHTDMQAFSPDETGDGVWDDMPAKIREILTGGEISPFLSPTDTSFMPLVHETDINNDFRGYLSGWVDYGGNNGEIGFSDLYGEFNKNYWQLENIVADSATGYSGMAVKAAEPKFAGCFSIGPDKDGKLSIISSYIPTPAEYGAWFKRHGTGGHPDDIAATITLSQGGRSEAFSVTHLYEGVLSVINSPGIA